MIDSIFRQPQLLVLPLDIEALSILGSFPHSHLHLQYHLPSLEKDGYKAVSLPDTFPVMSFLGGTKSPYLLQLLLVVHRLQSSQVLQTLGGIHGKLLCQIQQQQLTTQY